VARVVFLDLEDDLHQVRADVGDLGEDAARDAESGGAQGLADRESDEAGAGQIAGDEQQDEEHDQQLDGNEQHADAHARLQRDVITGERFAAKRGERRPRVGERVDAHAEGRDREAARDADDAEHENDQHAGKFESTQEAEIKNDNYGDEQLQEYQELALRREVG